MDRCKYLNIGPENIPIIESKKILHRLDIAQCPYARARAICPECGHEKFLDEDSIYRVTTNIKNKFLICQICAKPVNIMRDVDIICLSGHECLRDKEKGEL